jgi:hypothetical protein
MASEHDLVLLVNVGDNGEASVLRSYLEHHGIHVYIKGENHRSLLGMVGTYIDLGVMVPNLQFEDAKQLYREYLDGQNELEAPDDETDEIEDTDEEREDENWRAEAEQERNKRRAVLAAFILPIGGAHYSIGSYAGGLLLSGLSIYAIMRGVKDPAYFGIWGLAVAMDLFMSRQTLKARAKSAPPKSYVHSYAPDE